MNRIAKIVGIALASVAIVASLGMNGWTLVQGYLQSVYQAGGNAAAAQITSSMEDAIKSQHMVTINFADKTSVTLVDSSYVKPAAK